MKNTKIGFVGTGRMGANMARRLHECGYVVTAVFDQCKETAAQLADELGCEAATSLASLSRSCELVFTVVSDEAAMRAIFAKEQGLLVEGGAQTYVNCATVAPEVHRQLTELAAPLGVEMLEACMASSIPQARQGELYLMCAGSKQVYTRLEPVLQDLSKVLRYVGEVGQAAEVKALVNMVMNCNTAALAEGLGLAKAIGLDLQMVCEVFAQTGANSRVLETDSADMIERDHDCYFSASHAAKDSKIANDLANQHGVEVPLSLATEQQYRNLMDLGKGELDKSAVSELTFPQRRQAPYQA